MNNFKISTSFLLAISCIVACSHSVSQPARQSSGRYPAQKFSDSVFVGFAGTPEIKSPCLYSTAFLFQPFLRPSQIFPSIVADASHPQRLSASLGRLHDPKSKELLGLPGEALQDFESISVNGTMYHLFHKLGKGGEGEAFLALRGDEIVVVKRYYANNHVQFPYATESNIRSAVFSSQYLDQAGFAVARVIDFSLETGIVVREFIPGISRTAVDAEMPPSISPDQIKRLSDQAKALKHFQREDKGFKAAAEKAGVRALIDTYDVNFVFFNGRWWLIDP